jgi:hypothetical protein
MGRFSGLSGVSSKGGSSDFFPVGNHEVEVVELAYFQTQEDSKDCFKVGGKILDTDNDAVMKGASGVQVVKKNEGWKANYFLQDLKNFACAAITVLFRANDLIGPDEVVDDSYMPDGVTTAEELDAWWAESLDDLFDDDGKMAVGLKLYLTCETVNKRKSEGQWTKHTWSADAPV